MDIKCIGCYELTRLVMDPGEVIAYSCPRFPYVCAISGLLRPTRGILKAVNDCPDDPLSHCVVCSSTEITHYGKNIVSICKKHGAAWSKWLERDPQWRERLAPRGRAVKANWVEVFREFVEDIRRQQ